MPRTIERSPGATARKPRVGQWQLLQLIDEGKTYPVTVLPNLKKADAIALLENDIVLASEFEQASELDINRITGLDAKAINKLFQKAYEICNVP